MSNVTPQIDHDNDDDDSFLKAYITREQGYTAGVTRKYSTRKKDKKGDEELWKTCE